jgi:hypothetical protein
MCNEVCHTVWENVLVVNCSLIFKLKCQCIVHLFFLFFSLTIKDKTNISLTLKILHLRHGSFRRKVGTIFTLKFIVSIFLKLFLIIVLHLKFFLKRATDLQCNKHNSYWYVWQLVGFLIPWNISVHLWCVCVKFWSSIQ